MVSFLRHISIRIWIGLLLGATASFVVLPVLQLRLGLEYNVLSAGVLVAIFFWAAGWLMTRWALNTSGYLIAEAGAFERDGMYREAEVAYRKAVAVFDSFMISPSVRRKKSVYLGSRLARFYLARSRQDRASNDFLISYLHSHPRDETVAEHWLGQNERSNGLKEEHQELIERIGEAQPQNMHIQRSLARFYLLLERTDFPALQTYRRISRDDKSIADGFIHDLARLFVKEGRADEWALEIYLQALVHRPDQPEYLSGLAACLHWIPAGSVSEGVLQSAQRRLKEFDAAARKEMRQGFNSPILTGPDPMVRRKFKPGAVIYGAIRSLYSTLQSVLRSMLASSKTAFHLFQQNRKIRQLLGVTLLLGLAAGIGALVINTVGHLQYEEEAAIQTAMPARPVITDPFTLQVAAYLKPQYAREYVRQLKQQGLDAYWSEAVRGQKRWYQVRVSHFATKEAARSFGEKLKSQGIIEDYYVANYQPR